MKSSKDRDARMNKLILNVIDDVIKSEVTNSIPKPGDDEKSALMSNSEADAVLTKRVEEIVNKRIESTLGCKIGINSLQVMKNDDGGREKLEKLFKQYDNDEQTSILTNDNKPEMIRKKRNLVLMDVDIDNNVSINSIYTKDVDKSDKNKSDKDKSDRNTSDRNTSESHSSDPRDNNNNKECNDNKESNDHNKDNKELIDPWDSEHEESKDSDDGDIEKYDDRIAFRSFRDYLDEVDSIEDLRSMFISMILDFKERVKGCEHCETCSQVIQLVEINIKMYKKVSKLAQSFAAIFMHLINGNIPDKLAINQINLVNVILVLLVKNSQFPDVAYIYEQYKKFINVNAFEGLVLRLAIQKYKPADIRIMLLEWGCDITVMEHRPIIRAFCYEKFGIVRTMIELGSSYKYYLQQELSEVDYKIFQAAIDAYLAKEMPSSSRIEQELRIVGMINDYRLMIKETGEDDKPVSSDYFIEEFMHHFLDITDAKTNNPDPSNNTDTAAGNNTVKKKKKNKKKNKKKAKAVDDIKPESDSAVVNIVSTSELEPITEGTITADPITEDIEIKNISSSISNSENDIQISQDIQVSQFSQDITDNTDTIDLLNDETFGPDESSTDTILAVGSGSNKTELEAKTNKWVSRFKSSGLDWSVETYWDSHFYNIIGKYMLC